MIDMDRFGCDVGRRLTTFRTVDCSSPCPLVGSQGLVLKRQSMAFCPTHFQLIAAQLIEDPE